MKEAIKNILSKWGCCHEWEINQGFEVLDREQHVTIRYKYLYICKKCGKMKWVEA